MPLVGVRPGDPPADVVFASAFVALKKLLNAGLEARGLQPSLEVAGAGVVRTPSAPPEELALPEMTYMDDVAVPIEAPHA